MPPNKLAVYNVTSGEWYEIYHGFDYYAGVKYVDKTTSTPYLLSYYYQSIFTIDLRSNITTTVYNGSYRPLYTFDVDFANELVADTQNKTLYFFKFPNYYYYTYTNTSPEFRQVVVSFDMETNSSTYINVFPHELSGEIVLNRVSGQLYYLFFGRITMSTPDKICIFNLMENNYIMNLNISDNNIEPQNAGETRNFTASLNVTNNGLPVASSNITFDITNLSDGWGFDVLLPQGWGYNTFYGNKSEKQEIHTEFLNKTIILSVTPPENSTETEKTITLTAKFSKNHSISASTNLTIRVKPVHKVRVDNYTFNKTIKPGEDVNLSFSIKNRGGFQENVSVSFENNTFNMTNRTFALNLDEEKLINNTVKVPLTTDLGEYNTTATVSYGDGGNKTTINVVFHITVSAPKINVQSSLDRIQSIVDAPKTSRLNISNEGSELLNVSIETSGIFLVIPNQIQIPPHSSTSVNLTFAPTSNKTYYGNITIRSNDPTKPEVSMPVVGIGVGIPKISVNQTFIHSSAIVNVSANSTFIVSNIGTGNLTISNLTTTNPFVLNTTNFTLLPDEIKEIGITFIPTENKTYIGNLVLRTNDPLNPTINISLIGVGIGVLRAYLDSRSVYLSTLVDTTTNATIKLSNTGTADLIVFQTTVTQSFTTDLTNFTLKPNESMDINVTFIATENRTYYGNLTLYTNEPTNQTITIPLIGVGIGIPRISVNSTRLNFDIVKLNSMKNLSIEIKNNGTGALEISNITTGDGFYIDIATITLSPGAIKTMKVSFTPTENKTYYGNLTICSNDLNNPVLNISLTGIGEAPPTSGGGFGPPSGKWFIPYLTFNMIIINIFIISAIVELIRRRR
jgi:hypothetical protein